jgi:hypothetical protein
MIITLNHQCIQMVINLLWQLILLFLLFFQTIFKFYSNIGTYT